MGSASSERPEGAYIQSVGDRVLDQRRTEYFKQRRTTTGHVEMLARHVGRVVSSNVQSFRLDSRSSDAALRILSGGPG